MIICTDFIIDVISPGSFEDVVELLVPELQKRGVYWDEYSVPGGTLRENMLGLKGQRLVEDDHPASQFKWNVRKTNGLSAWERRQSGVVSVTTNA